MKRILAMCCLLTGLTIAAAAQTDADEQALIKLRNDIVAAALKGDKSTVEKYLAPGYFESGSEGARTTRAQALAEFTSLPASENARIAYDDYYFEHSGGIVILNARGTFTADLNGQSLKNTFRTTQVWEKTKGGWLLLSQHTSDIPLAPTVANIDPKIYDAYVGEYEFSPDIRVFVTRDGNRLMSRGSNEKAAGEIVPVDDHTFFFKTDPRGRVIFEKDAEGTVIGMIINSGDGQEFKAKKVK